MYQIVGKKRIDFMPKDADKPIKGYSYYVIYPSEDYEGYVADKIYVSDYILSKFDFTPALGDTVEIYYDKYQKVASFRKLDVEKK